MSYNIRKGLTLGSASLLIVFGFWLGEGGSPPWAVAPIASALLTTALVAILMPGKLWVKSIVGSVFLVLYAVAVFLGTLSFNRAYSECVERGEAVRVQLSAHYKKKSQFPERLNQLEGLVLCGGIIRPTILHYERTKEGYALSFQDWLVEYTATESEPFTAHK